MVIVVVLVFAAAVAAAASGSPVGTIWFDVWRALGWLHVRSQILAVPTRRMPLRVNLPVLKGASLPRQEG